MSATMRYALTSIRHQKQGLTFMIRREMGWNLLEKDQDVWSQTEVNNGLGRIGYVTSMHLDQ